MKTPGQDLKERRTAAGLTLAQLAELANLSTPYLSLLEHDKRGGARATRQRIEAALLGEGDLLEAMDLLRRGKVDPERVIALAKTPSSPPAYAVPETEALLEIARLAMTLGEVERVTAHPDGRPETDTTHTVMLALLVIATAPPAIDRDLAVVFAVVHDLLEAYTGDTNTAFGLAGDAAAEKARRETEALAKLRDAAGGVIVELVETYLRQDTLEARFVRYLDKVAPKLTHLLNGGLALRAMGMTANRMRQAHAEQGAALIEQYPEQFEVAEIFEDACGACEDRLSEALTESAMPAVGAGTVEHVPGKLTAAMRENLRFYARAEQTGLVTPFRSSRHHPLERRGLRNARLRLTSEGWSAAADYFEQEGEWEYAADARKRCERMRE